MTEIVVPVPTRRLVLRPVRAGDEADVLAYRSREDVTTHLMSGPMTSGDATAFIAERMQATRVEADHDRVFLAIELEGRVVGDVSLRMGRLLDRQGEIGWVLHPDQQGHGYAREAATALMGIGFQQLGLHRIHAQLDPRNTASAALCRALGMRQEAHLREESWFKGEWGDLLVFALLRSEWPQRR